MGRKIESENHFQSGCQGIDVTQRELIFFELSKIKHFFCLFLFLNCCRNLYMFLFPTHSHTHFLSLSLTFFLSTGAKWETKGRGAISEEQTTEWLALITVINNRTFVTSNITMIILHGSCLFLSWIRRRCRPCQPWSWRWPSRRSPSIRSSWSDAWCTRPWWTGSSPARTSLWSFDV